MCDKCKHNNVVGKGNLKQKKVAVYRQEEMNILYV